jgi:hypothetical protein
MYSRIRVLLSGIAQLRNLEARLRRIEMPVVLDGDYTYAATDQGLMRVPSRPSPNRSPVGGTGRASFRASGPQ